MSRLRPPMGWLHTWLGLVTGWLLFIMFVTGTCGYFRHEITLWMTPELQPLVGADVPPPIAARRAIDWLKTNAAGAAHWTINLPDERSPAIRVEWRPEGRGEGGAQTLDPRNGRPLALAPRETRGGDFLYRLHSDLHFIPAILGRVIVAFAGLTLLVTLFSGLVTHRHILRNLFRFRPRRGRRSWLDAHNILGVVALPFHLFVTYTGLVTVMILIMPWGVLSNYASEGLGGFAKAAFEQPVTMPETPRLAMPLPAIDRLIGEAQHHWGSSTVGAISIDRPGFTGSTVEIERSTREVLAMRKPRITFNGVTGQRIGSANEDLSSPALLHSQVFGLHVAHFAGRLTRFLFFVLGLAGAAMIATGMVLWSMKRQSHHTPRQVRMIEAANAAVIAGLPIAIGAYFWASQLLPPSLPARSDWEIDLFFIGWLFAFVFAAILSVRIRWRALWAVGSVMLAGAPFLASLNGVPFSGASIALLLLGLTLALAARFDLGNGTRRPAAAR